MTHAFRISFPQSEQLLWKAKDCASPVCCRASVTRLCEVAAQGGSLTACFVVPHPPGPVLSRIGDSEPALGRLSGLFIHNHPLSVMHREDA